MDTPILFLQVCCFDSVMGGGGGHRTSWRCCGAPRPLEGARCAVVENRTLTQIGRITPAAVKLTPTQRVSSYIPTAGQ